jgi:hypothetical protein
LISGFATILVASSIGVNRRSSLRHTLGYAGERTSARLPRAILADADAPRPLSRKHS